MGSGTTVVVLASSVVVVSVAVLAAVGTTQRWWWYPNNNNRKKKKKNEDCSKHDENDNYDWQRWAESQRRRLPGTIILVRHGESEANANHSMWQTIPDNLLGLTVEGAEQASEVGQRVAHVLERQCCQRVHLVVSPYERTLQTAARLRVAFEPYIVRTDIESRIREQVRRQCVTSIVFALL